jgi:hypothetical protein
VKIGLLPLLHTFVSHHPPLQPPSAEAAPLLLLMLLLPLLLPMCLLLLLLLPWGCRRGERLFAWRAALLEAGPLGRQGVGSHTAVRQHRVYQGPTGGSGWGLRICLTDCSTVLDGLGVVSRGGWVSRGLQSQPCALW